MGEQKGSVDWVTIDQEPLESLVDELVSIEQELEKAHFKVDRIILNESQAEHELLVKLPQTIGTSFTSLVIFLTEKASLLG